MTAFLLNAAGFFLQLFPCALMIFLPFPQEAYRFRRRQVLLWMTVLSLALALGFSAVLCLRDLERYPKHVVISNTSMLASILIILAAYIWLLREPLMKKLLVFFIVLFYAVAEYVLVNAVHALVFSFLPDRMPYVGSILLLYAAATALLLPLMLAAVIRPLREYIQKIEPRNMRRELAVTVFSTMVCFAMMIYCDTVTVKAGLLRYFLLPMLFLALNQILIYWLVFRESVRRQQDNEHKRALEIQQLQYEKIVGDMENTRRMHHDLRHHYSALNEMLQSGRLEEMGSYLSQVLETTTRQMNQVYCKDMPVNGLLQYYAGLARDEGIRCDIQAQCDRVTVDAADLTVLLGNAMENAINACREYPGDRWISVHVGTVQGSLAMEISNACKGVRISRRAETEDGFLPAELFLSGRTGGGYGLQSMAQTARKYGGSAKFRYNAEKETFTARIRLNMRAE